MIIGLLPDAAATETLLNNLAEAEFNLQDVSVVMRDVTQRATIAEDAGPFKATGVDELAQRLTQAGLAPREAQSYVEAVKRGKVFVALNAPHSAEAAAREMFSDQAAQRIKGMP